jgi:hypothetical protein
MKREIRENYLGLNMPPVGTDMQAAGGFLCTWAVLQGISCMGTNYW